MFLEFGSPADRKGFAVVTIFEIPTTQYHRSKIPPTGFVYFIDIVEPRYALYFNDLCSTRRTASGKYGIMQNEKNGTKKYMGIVM